MTKYERDVKKQFRCVLTLLPLLSICQVITRLNRLTSLPKLIFKLKWIVCWLDFRWFFIFTGIPPKFLSVFAFWVAISLQHDLKNEFPDRRRHSNLTNLIQTIPPLGAMNHSKLCVSWFFRVNQHKNF